MMANLKEVASKNKGVTGMIASATAILGLIFGWQQVGGPMPASQASVYDLKEDIQNLESRLNNTDLLVLLARLERLERDLLKAKAENNQELIFFLERQIEVVRRQIAKLEEES